MRCVERRLLGNRRLHLHVQCLPILGHDRAIRLLTLLPATWQGCWSRVCWPHHTLTLQVAPLVLQIHLHVPKPFLVKDRNQSCLCPTHRSVNHTLCSI